MADRLKYIRTEEDDIFIFSAGIPHNYVMNGMEAKVVSGGFVSMIDDKFMCYGESTSIGVKSNVADERYIEKLFKGKLPPS